MAIPTILPWMKQSHRPSTLRIQARDIRSFATIAEKTGESEIRRISEAMMLASDDMINGVWQWRE